MFNSLFGKKPPQNGEALAWELKRRSPLSKNHSPERAPTFSRVFRWSPPNGQTTQPRTVEVLGSFSGWEKLPLTRDAAEDSWQVTLENIPAHQTHHYMLLVDGKPASDKNCDGLAIPSSAQEAQYALSTERGPRVFMLFAQTK